MFKFLCRTPHVRRRCVKEKEPGSFFESKEGITITLAGSAAFNAFVGSQTNRERVSVTKDGSSETDTATYTPGGPNFTRQHQLGFMGDIAENLQDLKSGW